MSPIADDCPLPTRRDAVVATRVQGSERARQDRRRKRLGIWAASGVAVLVGAGTFVGFAVSGSGDSHAAAVTAGDLWQGTDVAVDSADSLKVRQGAASRAKYRSPIEVSQCVSVDSPSNGARTMSSRDVLYYPMVPGSYEVSSRFSTRVSPISGEVMAHEGDDYAADDGMPIYAVAPGTVIEVSQNDHSGGMTVIEHHLPDGTRFESAYLHQWPDTIPVVVGQEVAAGQQIGTVGSAGWSTGPHLHFEIHDASGAPVDPSAWMEEHGATYLGVDC